MRSLVPLRGALLATVLSTAACAPDGSAADPIDDGDEALTQMPMLVFKADGSITLSAPLVAGRGVQIRYEQSRIRQCTGDVNGQPAWVITGYASLGGDAPTRWDTGRVVSGRRVPVNQVIALPRSGELALWFAQTNRWGCQAWDSRNGANYRVAVRPAPGNPPPVDPQATPTLSFERNGAVTLDGALVAGQRLRVRYAQDRMTACTGTTMGNAAWGVTGFASINGAPATSFETGAAAAGGTRVWVDAYVDLSAPGDLALWFRQSNRWGCVAWDSRNGQNYHFSIASR